MKLNEIINYKTGFNPQYKNPDDKVNWKLPPASISNLITGGDVNSKEFKKYKYYPELQDSIFAGLSRLDVEAKKRIQQKYRFADDGQLHTLSPEKMLELDKELHQLLQIPY